MPVRRARALGRRRASACSPPSEADYEDTGGVGGTLAGNALSLAAMRATLCAGADRRRLGAHDPARPRASPTGVRDVDRATAASGTSPSSAAAPSTASSPRPRATAREAHAASDPALERYLHLHALNRGVLLTPFHNMALMAPTTTEADVDRHTEVFAEAVSSLGR